MSDEATLIKRRVEALVTQAQMNAVGHGGDAATAAADLMTAFVLLTTKCGGSPDVAVTTMLPHSKATVGAFWPESAVH